MNVPIFSSFLVLFAFIHLAQTKNPDFERKIAYLVNTIRINNEIVLNLTQDLRDEVHLAKVLELAKDLQDKGLPLAYYNNSLDLYREHKPDLIVPTVLLTIQKLDIDIVTGIVYVATHPLSAVEASPEEDSAKVVTNPFVDSKHTVKNISDKFGRPPVQDKYPNNTRGDPSNPALFENLISALGELAKGFADGLEKRVQLVPLAQVGRLHGHSWSFGGFVVALIEVNSSLLPLPDAPPVYAASAALYVEVDSRLQNIHLHN